MSINYPALKRPLLGAFFFTLVLLLGTAQPAPAQTEGVPQWSQAVNLSLSGSSKTPTMVQDSNGVVYVAWKDQFKGVVFASLADGVWSAPEAVNAPWGFNYVPEELQDVEAVIFTPRFIADNAGRVHAFWIDDTARLLQSTVESGQFVNGNWSPQVLISEAVVGFGVAVDDDNQLHITYVGVQDTDTAPAGVYYRRSNTFGGAWNPPIRLYESEYFRGLTSIDLDMQVLVVQTDEAKTIFTTFDNRPRRQFYMVRSGDGGTTWDAPILVAEPASSVDANVPNGIGLAYSNGQVLVLWRKVEFETPSNCVQYYQTFNLDGTPSEDIRTMFNEIDGCPLGRESVVAEGDRVIVLAQVFTETYLLAWDGDRWSPPQVQFELSNFVDPGTFATVDLGCLEMLMGAPDVMYLIGCDTGLGGDIWFSTRAATDTAGWFSTTDEWSSPIPLASAGGVISPITLASDPTGILHAIWAQTDTQFDDNKTLYYARWDGSTWTYILTIIQPAFAKVNTLASAVDPNAGRLYLVWSGGERGELYFTWANAALAGSASEWSPPTVLPMPRPIGGGADLLVDEAGTVYVVYSVPVNEQRGVYLIRSFDNGLTWDTPTLVLDGVDNGWEVVGSPTLARSPDGKLHVLVARHPPPEGDLSKRLYYTNSTDSGATWSVPLEFVVGDINRNAIGQISGRQLYRYWQESFDNVVTNYIQSSTDGGQTWSESMNFIGLDSVNPTSTIVEDVAGNLHIIQTAEFADNQLQLQEWLWNGSGWVTEKSLELGTGLLTANSGMAAAIRSDVFLGVLVSRATNDPAASGSQLIFVERQMEIVIPEAPEETPTPLPEPTATPAPTATPEPVLATETPLAPAPGEENPGPDNLVLQLAVGFTGALLVVVVASLLINRVIRRA